MVEEMNKLQHGGSKTIWQYVLGTVILLGLTGMILILMTTFGFSKAFIGMAMMLPAVAMGALVIFWLGYPLKTKHMIMLGMLAIGWGGGWAVFLAQTGTEFLITFNSVIGSDGTVIEVLPPGWTIVPVVEETGKALGIVLVFSLLGRRTKNVLAGVVIGACVGLGFSFMEDTGYVAAEIMNTKDAVMGLGLAIVRSMTIATHAGFSVLVGEAVGFAASRPMKRVLRIGIVFGAWLLAVCVHGFVNYSNVMFADAAISVLTSLTVAFVWSLVMFVGVVVVRYRYKVKTA